MSMRTELKELSKDEEKSRARLAELFEQMQEKMIQEGVAFARNEYYYDHSENPEEIREERDKLDDEYDMLRTLMFSRGMSIVDPEFDMDYVKKEIARRLTEKSMGAE